MVSEARAEAECKRWIRELSARPANKDKAFEAAANEIAGLSRRAFDRAWAAAAADEWKKAGAPHGKRDKSPRENPCT